MATDKARTDGPFLSWGSGKRDKEKINTISQKFKNKLKNPKDKQLASEVLPACLQSFLRENRAASPGGQLLA